MKKICIIIVAIICCLFVGCTQKLGGNYIHPDFSTDYSIEEHVERIKERTKQVFQDDIQSGAIIDYSVEIVYAYYDEDPEYFLVEIEYANDWNGEYHTNYPRYDDETLTKIEYTTKYKHLIGFIENDMYKTGLRGYFGQDKAAFKDGKSCYELLGYANDKKYYGAGVFAVRKNDEMMRIYYSLAQGPVGLLWQEECFDIATLSEKQQKQYMVDNRKNATYIYGEL